MIVSNKLAKRNPTLNEKTAVEGTSLEAGANVDLINRRTNGNPSTCVSCLDRKNEIKVVCFYLPRT